MRSLTHSPEDFRAGLIAPRNYVVFQSQQWIKFWFWRQCCPAVRKYVETVDRTRDATRGTYSEFREADCFFSRSHVLI